MSKKVFAIIAVVAMSIMPLVNVMPAKAATIVDGGEYTCTGGCFASWPASAVFLVQGANLYAYASANVWRTYHPGQADFSTVQTVSAADLASYTVKGYVAPKVGTFVKAMNTSFVGSGIDTRTVYLVGLNGVFHPVYLASVYKYWTGDNNWQNIYGLPDAFTTVVVPTIGSTLDSTTTAPEGMAAMSLTGDYGYVGAGNTFRAFSSQAALDANKFNKTMAAKLPVSLSAGANVTGAESSYVAYQTKATTTPPTVGNLSVTLAADNPASIVMADGAMNVGLLKFRLMAGANGAVVTGLKFKRTDVGGYDDWSAVYLFQDNVRITSIGRSINADHEVEFPALNINVPANGSVAVELRGDLNATNSDAGNRHVFQLTGVTSASSVSGLPLTGNAMVVGSQTVGTMTIYRHTTPSAPTVGAKEAEILTIKLGNTSTNQDISFNQLVLTYSGTMNRSEITNLKLYPLGESTVLASVSGVASNDTITLTLSTPYTVAKGVSKYFSLKADLGGKAAETLAFYVDQADHLVAIDKQYNVGATISIDSTIDAAADTSLTLKGGTLSIADNGPAAGKVSKNQNDVVLTKFSMTSQRNVEVRRLSVTLDATADFDNTDGDISDLRIKDLDTGTTLMSATIEADGDGVDKAYTLTNTFDLVAGKTYNLGITVDIGADADLDLTGSAHYLKANLAQVTYGSTQVYIYDTGTGQYMQAADVVPGSVSGDNQEILASSMSYGLASTPVSATFVKGATNVDSVGAIFTAGAGSNITIKQVKFRVYASDDGTNYSGTHDVDPAVVVTSCTLYDGTTALGSKVPTGYVDGTTEYSTMTFDGLNILVTKGTNKKLNVKCNTSSALTAERWYYVALEGSDDHTTAYDADGNTIDVADTDDVNTTPTVEVDVASAGTLAMALNGDTPVAATVVGGDTDVQTTWVDFSATKEDFKVTKLTVSIGNSTYTRAVKQVGISYPGLTTPVKADLDGSGNAVFNGLDWIVNKDTTEKLVVSADLNTIVEGATSGDQVLLKVMCSTASNCEAVGQGSSTVLGDSGAELSNITTANTMYLRKTKPTVTKDTGSLSAVLANGDMALYQTKVAANSKGDLTLKKLSFDVIPSDAGTGGALTFNTWKLFDSANMGTAISGMWTDGTSTSTSGAIAVTATKTMVFEPNSEILVTAGSSKSFVLQATVSNATQYDSVSSRISSTNDTGAGLTTGLGYHATELVQLDDGSTQTTVDFCWSDKSQGANHTAADQTTYADWTNGYSITTLPGGYFSLSK